MAAPKALHDMTVTEGFQEGQTKGGLRRPGLPDTAQRTGLPTQAGAARSTHTWKRGLVHPYGRQGGHRYPNRQGDGEKNAAGTQEKRQKEQGTER